MVRLSESEPDPAKRENTIKLNRDEQRPRPLIVQLHYWPKEKAEEKKDDKKKKKVAILRCWRSSIDRHVKWANEGLL